MKDIAILIIDDRKDHAEAAAESLEKVGYKCEVASSGREGLDRLTKQEFNIVLTDLKMPDMDGMEVLRQVKKHSAEAEVIMMTAYSSVETAVEAMQKGAATYLKKPLNIRELRQVVENVVEKQRLLQDNINLHRQLDKKYGFEGLIGNSAKMQRVFESIQQVAGTSVSVLIQGESGTGKELVARSIHYTGSRRNNHFVPLNCAALSEGILESELFGHEKGAFTGAIYQRKGRFEFAHLGTLFLDEIGDMPMTTQIKLLRVIEDGEILRVGNNIPIKVDVRLITATNQDLEELVKNGNFREDLYFRLKVITMNLPPLRERKDDIPVLVHSFIKEFNRIHHKNIKSIPSQTLEVLTHYPWPGNVRELKNCVESMVVTTRGNTLNEKNISAYIREGQERKLGIGTLSGVPIERAEKELIKNTLASVQGNRVKAAHMLGVGERTLYRKLKKYKLA